MLNKEVVKVSQLNKTFMSKNGIVKAIDNVSFTIKKGEIVGLIGESGSGKTTIGRALLRLHTPDSGSVNISGREYASKKISRKYRKSLRNNAQMIFQDPYSSLNGQKNILHIVSEPLKVNGTDKEMVNEYLENRSEMLVFFKSTLNTYFHDLTCAHIELKYKEQIRAYEKAIKDIEAVVPEKTDVKLSLYNIVIGAYYKTLASAHTKIINSSTENLNSFFNKWKDLKQNLETESVDDWDEIELIKAKKKYSLAKEKFKHSLDTRKIKNSIKEIKIKIKDIKEQESKQESVSIATFNEVLEQHRLNIKEAKINMSLSKNYATQNFLKASIAKDKKVIHELSKVLKENTRFVEVNSNELIQAIIDTISNLYKEIFDTYKKATKDDAVARKSYSEIQKEVFNIEWNKNTTFIKFISKTKSINNELINKNYSKVLKLKSVIEKSKEELAKSIKADKLRDKKALSKALSKTRKNLKKAKIDNLNERKIFEEKYEKEFIKISAKKAEKLEKLKNELRAMKEYAGFVYKNKMKSISDFETDYSISENELAKNEFELKTIIDNSIKDKQEKNESLIQEWNRLDHYQGIVKELFGINKTKLLKLRLKKLLVRLEVFETLQHVGLQPAHAFRYPHEFSGGMRQRVGIARAVINKPDFIIADEPIAALDLSIQAQVVNMLLEQKERLGLAMLFIAHDLSMVRFNSDRILIMHLGKLVEYGETEEIFKNPRHPYTKNLIKTMPSLNNLAQGFKDSTFIPEYLEEYSMSNKPFYIQVGKKDHFILADYNQAKEWISSNDKAKTKTVLKKR